MAYRDVILTDTPIEYWEFNETSGTTAASTGSGAHSATHTGGVTVGGLGVSGSGATYDGVDDGTTATGVADFANLSTFTVEFWAKFGSPTTDYPTFIRRDGGSSTFLVRTRNATQGRGNIIEAYFNGRTTDTGVYTFNDNAWHHIVVVRNGVSLRLWVDNVEYTTGNGTVANAGTGNTPLYLGGNGASAIERLNGSLDEVAIYNKVLTTGRISAHFAAKPVITNINVAAPASTISMAGPAPVVTAVNSLLQTLTPIADGIPGSGTQTSSILDPTGMFFKFNVSIPEGYRVGSAVLTLTPNGHTIPSSYVTKTVTSDWTEASIASTTPATTGTKDSGTATSPTYAFDVTNALRGDLGYGISIARTALTTGNSFFMRESTAANRPKLTVQLEVNPVIPVTVTAPAATVTLAAPAVVVTAQDTSKSYAVIAGVATLNVSAPTNARIRVDAFGRATSAGSVSVEMMPASVTTTKAPRIQVYATTLTLMAPGGAPKLPDKRINAPAVETWIFTPSPKGYIEVPSVSQVSGAASLSLAGTNGHGIDLKTNRTVYVTNSARMGLRMVGIYSAEDDRYNAIIPTTVDVDDVWLPLNETTGTVAHDVLTSGATEMDTSGTLVGGPTLNVSGPDLRPAMSFDGVDDWINMGEYNPASTFGGMDVTIELSLKTSDLNGTLITGGATTQQTSSSPNTLGNSYSFSEVRLVNGNIVLSNGSTTWTVRKNVADGQWHHIVISVPAADNGADTSLNVSTGDPAYVAIDGVTVWKRYEVALDGRYLLPEAIMARAGNWYPAGPSNFLAGELSNLIFRLNSAISESVAQKLYYEWSNTTVAHAEPAVITVGSVAPFKAAGNTKKMLALYGLPYGLQRVGDQITGSTRDGWGNYYSVFAGYYINTNSGISNIDGNVMTSSNITRMRYLEVKPFQLEGYMVYPMAIMKQAGSNGGPFSAAGLENGEYIDPLTGLYIDDATGLPRFVDINKDLVGDITDFDAITVVNYPAPRPDDGAENAGNSDPLREPRQHNMGLTNSQWESARNALRDTILDALYDGVNLWGNEPHMAEHLGFIKAWDKHDTGARVEFYAAGNVDATGFTNTYAYELDLQHIRPGAITNGLVRAPGPATGQFNFTWQANAKRRITNLEPGLTDLPAWERVEMISWDDVDDFKPYAYWRAMDVADRMNGLRVGDEILMEMWEQNDAAGYSLEYPWSVGQPRRFIVSARPDGIAGKIISREMESYHGPNGVVRVNPYRNNVYTIAAEVGTVVRGRPIAGRAFFDFMGNDTTRTKVPVDRDRTLWMGNPGQEVSSWSFDSRRYKENVAVSLINTVRQRKQPNGDVVLAASVLETRYAEVQSAEVNWMPYMGMNARGLNWLQQKSTVPAGTARVFVPAVEISLAGAGVQVSKTRNISLPVTGAAQVYLEARATANFRDGNVTETAIPVVLTIEVRGIGKSIKTDPVVLDLTTPNARVVGQGDRIYVYMDASRNVTLYMKEN